MNYTPHTARDVREMLDAIGKTSIDELFSSVPDEIKFKSDVDIPEAHSEAKLRRYFTGLANKITVFEKSFLGAGSYRHYIPSAVNAIAADGEFFTAYTPYQAEASQGTLQVIYEYQSYISSLTGMDVSNASLYDGATAVCEASIMARSETRRNKIVVSKALHPEYIETLKTYIGSENVIETPVRDGLTCSKKLVENLTPDTAAVILQNPNFLGCIENPSDVLQEIKKNKSLLIIAVNEPYSFGTIKNPGECGADIAVGDAQSFGMPTSFGGPSLGFIAVKRALMRKIPGRLCGKTVDVNGKEGFVLTLQAREQHIRRDKSSSNICSNQALCALLSVVHLSLIGKGGFLKTAENNMRKAHYAAEKIAETDGYSLLLQAPFFNEFVVKCEKADAEKIADCLSQKGIAAGVPLGRFFPELKDCLLVAVTELNTKEDIDELVRELKGAAVNE